MRNPRWPFNRVPGFSELPEKRQKWIAESYTRHVYNLSIIACLLIFACVSVGIMALHFFGQPVVSAIQSRLLSVALFFALVFLGPPIFFYLLTPLIARRYVTRGIRVLDRNACSCGYDLMGIESDKCPECGHVIAETPAESS